LGIRRARLGAYKLFLLIGVAEDHDSNPIKLGLGRLKERGAKIISINPVRAGYSAISDEFVGITPGTDGLLVLALIHCLLEAGQIDLDFLVRYTNAHYLVVDAPGDPDHGLFARDKGGKPLAYDRRSNGFVDAEAVGIDPAPSRHVSTSGWTIGAASIRRCCRALFVVRIRARSRGRALRRSGRNH
jgi:anaerobic selenocysteine-containing dehydrogenase